MHAADPQSEHQRFAALLPPSLSPWKRRNCWRRIFRAEVAAASSRNGDSSCMLDRKHREAVPDQPMPLPICQRFPLQHCTSESNRHSHQALFLLRLQNPQHRLATRVNIANHIMFQSVWSVHTIHPAVLLSLTSPRGSGFP